MEPSKKRGRKPRPYTPGERALLAQFSGKLNEIKSSTGRNVEDLARELGVCKASFYNYLKGTDLPGWEVLRRAHEKWGFTSDLLDFRRQGPMRPRPKVLPRQYKLSFLSQVHERDVEIVSTRPVGSDTLELLVKIKFG